MKYLAAAICLLWASTALAQTATTTQDSGVVATQNTFQSVLVEQPGRRGALIQNTAASDVLYVFFGAIGGATKGKSWQVPAGGTIGAVLPGGVILQDQISVTCASATPSNCTFVYSIQR